MKLLGISSSASSRKDRACGLFDPATFENSAAAVAAAALLIGVARKLLGSARPSTPGRSQELADGRALPRGQKMDTGKRSWRPNRPALPKHLIHMERKTLAAQTERLGQTGGGALPRGARNGGGRVSRTGCATPALSHADHVEKFEKSPQLRPPKASWKSSTKSTATLKAEQLANLLHCWAVQRIFSKMARGRSCAA